MKHAGHIHPRACPEPHLQFQNQAGFALLPFILSLIVVGGLMGAGLTLVGPKVKLAKTTRTAETLDHAVQSVISWSAVNGRLPDNTEFPGIIKETNDAWLNSIAYVYDTNLSNLSSGGLCGRQSTLLTSGSTADAAFILISWGEDVTLDTPIPANGIVTTTTTIDVLGSDMGRVVSHAKLQNRSGCFGATRGRLRILNNEMPSGVSPKTSLPTCSGLTYNASIYAEGGVPSPISPYYNWTYTVPTWMALTHSTDSRLDLQGNPANPGIFTIDVTVSDGSGNSFQKSFTIDVNECVP